MALFRRLPANQRGRDFVVGDVHGCFEELRVLLAMAGFSPTCDRLLSVGDLVDRGPRSEDAVKWLAQPWMHAVRGNHEQMAIEAVGSHPLNAIAHRNNGGEWWYRLNLEQQVCAASAFDDLPYAIEVEVGTERIGLVHAEVPGDDWTTFTRYLVDAEGELPGRPANFDHVERFALWGRDVIRGRSPFAGVAGIDRVYVGHTPVADVQVNANVHYIDTGMVFGRRLTLICLQDGQALQYP